MSLNEERQNLIIKKYSKGLTENEKTRLSLLQKKIAAIYPRKMDLDKLVACSKDIREMNEGIKKIHKKYCLD